jgi:pimeloyl-ACP methyl ester carboxylesterase
MTLKAVNSSASKTFARVGGAPVWAIGATLAAAGGAAGFNALRAKRANDEHPPLGEFVTVDGVKLHYLSKGAGPTVVLVHGNDTMIEDWIASGVFDALAKTHRVIAFDRPGFGHSERPRSVIWTPAAQARLLDKALSSFGETNFTVVGHSFGTMVALAMALDHPKRVSSLVLLGGYYYPTARLDALMAAPPAIPIVGDAIRYTVSPLLGAALKPGMEKQVFGPAGVSRGWREHFPFEMTLRPSQIRAASADAALMVPAASSLSKRLPELKVPVTIIAGASDQVIDPKSQSERLAAVIDDRDLIMVKGAGHMVHHTSTPLVLQAIRAAAK